MLLVLGQEEEVTNLDLALDFFAFLEKGERSTIKEMSAGWGVRGLRDQSVVLGA